MAGYRLVTYASAAGPRAGIVIGDEVFDAGRVTGHAGDATVLGILDDWAAARDRLGNAAPAPGAGQKLAATRLLAPVWWPSAIYCAGANYADHAAEMGRLHNRPPEPDPHTLGLKPWHFIKSGRSTLAGPGDAIPISALSKTMDWEIELAAVIGRSAKNVALERALDHVAGYTIANDLSARDMGRRPHVPDASPFKFDWVAHKNFDGSCPLGPWIVPAGDIPDPQKLGLKLWVNDVVKQDSNTARMIFTIAEQIAHLSSRITLNPGDVILTGTPSGVGAARQEFLKPGDVVRLWIEHIGTLSNRMA
ncbi:MAG TPA: fumarylacetoacetate hydrolase family protein [Xanthobacteraceae bacterium]|jgi:2-keto-4-pentenoate hydratase/2-oxohepta-3-ene-1,7-dioic acid hydratase in catechol pathway|nr:fumarylacetoacetate hydrolase family protein [Xanthobacteraceae bacterium]